MPRAARYAVATRALAAQAGPEQWRQFRELCANVIELRRGDHSAERLRLERERLELERREDDVARDSLFWEWAVRQENRDRICAGHLCREEREQRLRAILNIPPDQPLPRRPGSSTSNQGESRPMKPEDLPCA